MDKSQRELLILELHVGHEGYKYRDKLVPREFAYMLQVFFLFAVLTTAAKAFRLFNEGFTVVVLLLFGVTGFLALTTFLIDMEANISCKRALRKRGIEIEGELDGQTLKLWKTIADRPMLFEEGMLKHASRGSPEPSAATGFVWSARLLVLLWVLLVVVVIFWRHTLNLN